MDEICQQKIDDLNLRKSKYQNKAMQELDISETCSIYRAVNKIDKKNPELPDFKCFTDKGLSVFIKHEELPDLNLDQILEEWKGKGYVGIWRLDKTAFPSAEFVIRHDPFPYEEEGDEVQQGPHHAQIFCCKPQSKAKEIRSKGGWAIPPQKMDEE